MEVSLAKLEDVWSKVEWVFTRFKQTDIYTVKLGEEDFEMLEDNQVRHQPRNSNNNLASACATGLM
eukprot:6170673-Pyramimonas_sp.AAC.1